MANQLTRTIKNSIRAGKQCAAIETKIHVTAIRYYVAKPILKRFTCERKSNRDCVPLDDGFYRCRRLLQH
jgi:hypothetical protein